MLSIHMGNFFLKYRICIGNWGYLKIFSKPIASHNHNSYEFAQYPRVFMCMVLVAHSPHDKHTLYLDVDKHLTYALAFCQVF